MNHVRSAFIVLILSCWLAVAAHASDPVNINTATAEELAQALTGVGAVKAAAIVADREQNGPFASVEELTRVSGVGDKVLEDNQGRMSVE